MKKRILFIITIIILPLISFAHSGDTVYVEQGTSPVIDGIISAGEWDDAEIITFTGYNGIIVTCYLKHNGTDTLYIAQDVPEMIGGDHGYIWFDTDNDGGTAPKTDDFWLSSYYFDRWPYIESLGTGTNWGTWVSPINWYREHTGEGWSYDHGQMEFAIAFDKIGITADLEKTIGFMIGFGDNPDQTDCWFWPSSGYNHKNPNAWADLLFFNTQTYIREQDKNHSISIYPNPTTGFFIIKGENLPAGQASIQSIEITNISGQTIKQLTTDNLFQINLGNEQLSIDLSNKPKGIYFVKIQINNQIYTNKFIVK